MKKLFIDKKLNFCYFLFFITIDTCFEAKAAFSK